MVTPSTIWERGGCSSGSGNEARDYGYTYARGCSPTRISLRHDILRVHAFQALIYATDPARVVLALVHILSLSMGRAAGLRRAPASRNSNGATERDTISTCMSCCCFIPAIDLTAVLALGLPAGIGPSGRERVSNLGSTLRRMQPFPLSLASSLLTATLQPSESGLRGKAYRCWSGNSLSLVHLS